MAEQEYPERPSTPRFFLTKNTPRIAVRVLGQAAAMTYHRRLLDRVVAVAVRSRVLLFGALPDCIIAVFLLLLAVTQAGAHQLVERSSNSSGRTAIDTRGFSCSTLTRADPTVPAGIAGAAVRQLPPIVTPEVLK